MPRALSKRRRLVYLKKDKTRIVRMDYALELYRKYYLSVHPSERMPGDLGVQITNAVSPKGGPMIEARLRVGEREMRKVVVGYRLGDCTKTFLQDLRESMVFYFVQHHLDDFASCGEGHIDDFASC